MNKKGLFLSICLDSKKFTLSKQDISKIDNKALEAGQSRSVYIARLLKRHINLWNEVENGI